MSKANNDIREKAVNAGVKLWEIAARYGINDGNFTRLLRVELPEEKKQRIFSIIEEIKTERATE